MPARNVGPPSRLARLLLAGFTDLAAGDLVLIAVSGGPDSTALLHLAADVLRQRGLVVAAAHLDHGLRPDSVDDRAFVAERCRVLGLQLHAARIDVRRLAGERRRGLEEAARHARYGFLSATAEGVGARAIALGHTRDDRAETLLLNLVRGAGAAGLGAMRAHASPLIRRPLLRARRHQLVAYLDARGFTYRLDPSNDDRAFRRNTLRHDVLPRLLTLNPAVIDALARTAELSAIDDDYLSALAAPHLRGPVAATTLAALPEAVARRVVRGAIARAGVAADVGQRHIDAILDLARGVTGTPLATDLPGGVRASVERGEIRFRPTGTESPPDLGFRHPLAVPGSTRVPERALTIDASPSPAGTTWSAAGASVHVATSALAAPVHLRPPQPGDRFRPLGSGGSRPLGRYLRDRGVPARDRGRITLLAGSGGILWVVGHQIAEAARVAPESPAITLSARPIGNGGS